MELSGEVAIPAARERVWAALNDPDVLARCIDGVESLTKVADSDVTRFEGKMKAAIGPVRATFAGEVALTEVQAPESYVLVGEGKGGVAGFAKGQARVKLIETGPAATLLAYQVSSSVGGKIAQLGSRLIEGAAKGYAETFFQRLAAEVSTPVEPAGAAPAPTLDAAVASSAMPATPAAMPEALTETETPIAAPVSTPVELPGGQGLPSWAWAAALVAVVLLFLAWKLM